MDPDQDKTPGSVVLVNRKNKQPRHLFLLSGVKVSKFEAHILHFLHFQTLFLLIKRNRFHHEPVIAPQKKFLSYIIRGGDQLTGHVKITRPKEKFPVTV